MYSARLPSGDQVGSTQHPPWVSWSRVGAGVGAGAPVGGGLRGGLGLGCVVGRATTAPSDAVARGSGPGVSGARGWQAASTTPRTAARRIALPVRLNSPRRILAPPFQRPGVGIIVQARPPEGHFG